MNIIIIDNYDSFTYNLVHLVEEITGKNPEIIPNDRLEGQDFSRFDKIILSPGPGIPSEAGSLMDFIRNHTSGIPVLGVCLGQQAIAEVFGAKLKQLGSVAHGISSRLTELNDEKLYKNLEPPIQVGRYHSWVVDEVDLPEVIQITSRDDHGLIMSLKHAELPFTAVQFHPESILTPDGKTILSNWIFA